MALGKDGLSVKAYKAHGCSLLGEVAEVRTNPQFFNSSAAQGTVVRSVISAQLMQMNFGIVIMDILLSGNRFVPAAQRIASPRGGKVTSISKHA